MANFKQHLSFGFIGTGLLIAPVMATGMATTSEATLIWMCGVIGSILPDIDSDTGTAQDLVFTALGLFFIYTLLDNYGLNRSAIEIFGLIIFGYGCAFFLRLLFQKTTVHRGIFHSILTGFFFAFLTSYIAWLVYQVQPFIAWLAASFMGIGFVMHLFLDEIYSVDFMNAQLKKSFGSALKLFSYTNFKTSIAMLLATAGLWWLTPSAGSFVHVFSQSKTYMQLFHSLSPY